MGEENGEGTAVVGGMDPGRDDCVIKELLLCWVVAKVETATFGVREATFGEGCMLA